MALEMVQPDRGNAQGVGETVRGSRPDEKRSGKPGPLGVGDAPDVRQRQARSFQNLSSQGEEPPDLVARRKLGHDAAVSRVHCDLRVESVGEKAAARVVERDAGFIARSFDAEDDHAGVFEGCRG